MSHVSSIGMMLYLILAILGGFLTGLFSRYAYVGMLHEFGRGVAILMNVVFYIAPGWALLSFWKEDDLDVFYGLLLVSFAAGIIYYHKHGGETEGRVSRMPDEDD